MLGEARIVALLRHHYGDGGVYVPEGGARRRVFLEASRLGFINEDGYLTRKGRELLAQHGD